MKFSDYERSVITEALRAHGRAIEQLQDSVNDLQERLDIALEQLRNNRWKR